MNEKRKDGATITGWGVLLGAIFMCGLGIAIGGLIWEGDNSSVDLPPSVEERCGEAADEICPGNANDYSRSQEEACRRAVFTECLSKQSEPTMAQCRDECADIVRDLRNANDDLWERWLACSDPDVVEYENPN